MKVNDWLSFCRWTHVVFGTGYLDRFVLFECKYLLSVYINVWNVIEHDRFHTHAFPSVSIFVRGSYDEEQLGQGIQKFSAPMARFIPRTSNHRMLKSTKNAISITIAGPWDRLWTETFMDGTKRLLQWGRGELMRQPGLKPPSDAA